MNDLIPAFTLLGAISTFLAWYFTLYLIDNSYGFEANPFSQIVYEQPVLALGRNLAMVAAVGLFAYRYRKRTKLAYLPALLLAYVFFFDYIRDLTNALVASHLIG